MQIPNNVRWMVSKAVAIVGGAIVGVYYLLEFMVRIWIWILQTANVFLGPVLNLTGPDYRYGDPDEHIFSVVAKNGLYGTCRACKLFCSVLEFTRVLHCRKSIEADEGDIV